MDYHHISVIAMYIMLTIVDLITALTLVSAQSNNFGVFKFQLLYFYLLLYKSICCWYSFELPQLVEAIQMSTNNIGFYKENQKKIHIRTIK